jgi:glycerol-3-phosphate acyltransferase PlsY
VIINEVVTGIIVIVIGYLLGSIPSAYIATRLARGKDVRQLGGGNVGGLNVYREVGA